MERGRVMFLEFWFITERNIQHNSLKNGNRITANQHISYLESETTGWADIIYTNNLLSNN